MGKKLYRSRRNQTVGGVCAGVAEYFGWDPTLVRVITAVAVLFGGISFWFYVLAWVIIPVEPKEGPVPVQVVVDDEPVVVTPKPAVTLNKQEASGIKEQNKKEENGPEW